MQTETKNGNATPQTGEKEIYLAGGCFWGTQHYLRQVAGVRTTQVGYANGTVENPSYERVCAGDTGFAEAVRIVYHPAEAPLAFLLKLYFESIDPTSINRQGNDRGEQYRTGIYYTDEGDRPVIEEQLRVLAKQYSGPLAVECEPLRNFYPAEESHQDYLVKHSGGYCHISRSLMEAASRARPGAPEQKAAYRKPEDAELRERLTPEQYAVTRENATEPPFQNAYWNEHRRGIYVDITTGQPLFTSEDKFDSGCGWPSFAKPLETAALAEQTDSTHGMHRTEVRSALGDAHLGHVFPDGPRERGGLRYCINSAALRFIPEEELEAEGYGGLKTHQKEK